MPHQRLDSLKSRRLASGLSIGDVAKRAACSDWMIVRLESGGTCDPQYIERIVDALGPSVAVTSSSVANPTVLTTAAHQFVSADTVLIAGHTGSTPAVDGTRVATVTGGTTFTVPVNVSVGGTGGTARMTAATLGHVSMA